MTGISWFCVQDHSWMSEAAGGCMRKRARPAASDGWADGKTTAKEALASAVEEAEEYY